MIHLRSCRLKHFKAIRDTQTLRFDELTVLIGNNGSGKSSVLEALMTYQTLIREGLDAAMAQWMSFEHIRNLAVERRDWTAPKKGGERPRETQPMSFDFRLRPNRVGTLAQVTTRISAAQGGNELFVCDERVKLGNTELTRDGRGSVRLGDRTFPKLFADGASVVSPTPSGRIADLDLRTLAGQVLSWQFLMLSPETMGKPRPRQRATSRISLARDGSNIAEYLLSIRELDRAAFDGIVDTLRYVLGYAKELQPKVTSELQRSVYLELTEQKFKVPGWLLSTGTLRILALLAVLRHPQPPPLLVIEEVENGLDPRTLHLVVEELKAAVDAGATQVILTTHSPYLLDLLPLRSIVLVERDQAGAPQFKRPGDDEELQHWAAKFAPGQLYTMGRLHQGSNDR